MEMTPSLQQSLPAESPDSLASWTWKALLVGCAAFCIFASSIHDRAFEDEYAYITQSYYADYFFAGALDHPVWLDFFAYDLQPLPKYLIGLSLHWAKQPMPGPKDARNWYSTYAKFGTPATRWAARWPSVALGSLGCMALFGCGTLIKSVRLGAIAAILFLLNPLYSLHAHRAMSDVPCEAFVTLALGLALLAWKWAWTRRSRRACLLIWALAGFSAGLGASCKFNAFLAGVVVAAWTVIGLCPRALDIGRKFMILSGSITMVATATFVFVMLNPYLTARPSTYVSPEKRRLVEENPCQRFLFQVRHRLAVSEVQQNKFPDDALHTLADRCEVVAVQGFGRFGPFGPSWSDSRVRFDLDQDRGAILWAAVVLFGLIESMALGQGQSRAGVPPTGIALLSWAALAWLVVTVYLPMAWDRYLLPIQAVNALLAALGTTMIWDRLVQIRSTFRARA
jgi:4-amino-4-deoxy-L-arabinose transferase-like glycosyltransferase